MTVHTKINHVAMSVPADQLDQAVRDDIMAFYGEVFGWSENPSEEPGNPLIIRIGEPTQFVYVQPEAGKGMRAARMDHYGVESGRSTRGPTTSCACATRSGSSIRSFWVNPLDALLRSGTSRGTPGIRPGPSWRPPVAG